MKLRCANWGFFRGELPEEIEVELPEELMKILDQGDVMLTHVDPCRHPRKARNRGECGESCKPHVLLAADSKRGRFRQR